MTKLSLFIVCAMAATAATAFAGNGAPKGAHYNLNILGKDHCSPDDMVGSNRHTIQVELTGGSPVTGNGIVGDGVDDVDVSTKVNKIYLQEGPDFAVLDGNACDKNGALFQLPNPYPTGDLSKPAYSIFARALGTPKGEPSATITTCATYDPNQSDQPDGDEEIVCSSVCVWDEVDNAYDCQTQNVVLKRTKGKSTFANVTTELTTITYYVWTDANDNGAIDNGELQEVIAGLFTAPLEDFFWNYQNNGLRLAQLRFYPN